MKYAAPATLARSSGPMLTGHGPVGDRPANPRATLNRSMLFLLAALLPLTACRSPSPGTPDSSSAPSPSSNVVASGTASVHQPHQEAPEPFQPIRGRVLNRNDQARFVVIELIFSPVPELGRRLAVYRDGAKIGELRTSRWSRGALVAADIIHGDAQPGDEVKAD